MKKTICDICGKNVGWYLEQNTWGEHIEPQFPMMTITPQLKRLDLCTVCHNRLATVLNQEIETIKSETNQ